MRIYLDRMIITAEMTVILLSIRAFLTVAVRTEFVGRMYWNLWRGVLEAFHFLSEEKSLAYAAPSCWMSKTCATWFYTNEKVLEQVECWGGEQKKRPRTFLSDMEIIATFRTFS